VTIRKYQTSDLERLYDIDQRPSKKASPITSGAAHYTGARTAGRLWLKTTARSSVSDRLHGASQARAHYYDRRHLPAEAAPGSLAAGGDRTWRSAALSNLPETPVDDFGARGLKSTDTSFERLEQYQRYDRRLVMMKTERRSFLRLARPAAIIFRHPQPLTEWLAPELTAHWENTGREEDCPRCVEASQMGSGTKSLFPTCYSYGVGWRFRIEPDSQPCSKQNEGLCLSSETMT
jgi:hypothetical protein